MSGPGKIILNVVIQAQKEKHGMFILIYGSHLQIFRYENKIWNNHRNQKCLQKGHSYVCARGEFGRE